MAAAWQWKFQLCLATELFSSFPPPPWSPFSPARALISQGGRDGSTSQPHTWSCSFPSGPCMEPHRMLTHKKLRESKGCYLSTLKRWLRLRVLVVGRRLLMIQDLVRQAGPLPALCIQHCVLGFCTSHRDQYTSLFETLPCISLSLSKYKKSGSWLSSLKNIHKLSVVLTHSHKPK